MKAHKSITSHWLTKEIVSGMGIGTETFKTYSDRGTSSSAAWDKRVHISDILNVADRSKDSTFTTDQLLLMAMPQKYY